MPTQIEKMTSSETVFNTKWGPGNVVAWINYTIACVYLLWPINIVKSCKIMVHIMLSSIVALEAEIKVIALVTIESHSSYWMCAAAITSVNREHYI